MAKALCLFLGHLLPEVGAICSSESLPWEQLGAVQGPLPLTGGWGAVAGLVLMPSGGPPSPLFP